MNTYPEDKRKIFQEPVIDKASAIRIATALGWEPKREWVGLTDEEHTNIQKQADYNQFMSASEFAVRCQVLVEAKLKEKNTWMN